MCPFRQVNFKSIVALPGVGLQFYLTNFSYVWIFFRWYNLFLPYAIALPNLIHNTVMLIDCVDHTEFNSANHTEFIDILTKLASYVEPMYRNNTDICDV